MSRSRFCLWFGRCLALGLDMLHGPIVKTQWPKNAHRCRVPGFACGLGDVWLWVWICSMVQFKKKRWPAMMHFREQAFLKQGLPTPTTPTFSIKILDLDQLSCSGSMWVWLALGSRFALDFDQLSCSGSMAGLACPWFTFRSGLVTWPE